MKLTPNNNHHITLRLSDMQFDFLNALSKDLDCSFSEVIRNLIDFHIIKMVSNKEYEHDENT